MKRRLPPWPEPPDEAARIGALHALDILDRPRSAELDALTRLASSICGTPTAALNLLDTDRQWQAAAHGTKPVQVTRAESMCGHSILSLDVTYTPDASLDPVFAKNPHVTGRLGRMRLYAAAPLVVAGHHVVGTLTAFSPEASRLTRMQVEQLRALALTTARLLEQRATPAPLGAQWSRLAGPGPVAVRGHSWDAQGRSGGTAPISAASAPAGSGAVLS